MGQPGSGFHQAMNSAAAINRNALAQSSADRLGFSTRPSIPPPPPPPRCTAAPAPAPEPETGAVSIKQWKLLLLIVVLWR